MASDPQDKLPLAKIPFVKDKEPANDPEPVVDTVDLKTAEPETDIREPAFTDPDTVNLSETLNPQTDNVDPTANQSVTDRLEPISVIPETDNPEPKIDLEVRESKDAAITGPLTDKSD